MLKIQLLSLGFSYVREFKGKFLFRIVEWCGSPL